jgi:glycine/D-amino acid oxidase-like deaminating enzyme
MDLRSGQCFWPLKNGLLAVYPPLEADASCGVAIVGGGITGALVAHRLVHAGHDCIMIDKRDTGWGSTLASTALLQYEIDVSLTDLSSRIGPDDAGRAYTLCHQALADLEAIVARLRTTSNFQRRPSLFLGKGPEDVEVLRAEAEARRALGIRVDFLDQTALRQRYGLDRPAALLSADAAQMDPFRLTHALLADATARGLRVFDRTQVLRYEPRGDGAVLSTDRGPAVTARRVVFATGYEAQSFLKQRIVDLKSTYALVTEPIPERRFWPNRCLIWETGTPYFYLRTTADNRAMMGGEDLPFRNPAARDRLTARRAQTLIGKFRGMFPGLDTEVAYCWAGTFGETKDGLAYAGESPEYPGALFALGFGGNGTTFGVILARIIDDLVAGRPNQDLRLFRFDR